MLSWVTLEVFAIKVTNNLTPELFYCKFIVAILDAAYIESHFFYFHFNSIQLSHKRSFKDVLKGALFKQMGCFGWKPKSFLTLNCTKGFAWQLLFLRKFYSAQRTRGWEMGECLGEETIASQYYGLSITSAFQPQVNGSVRICFCENGD